MISIVIPTIDSREEYLERAIASFAATTTDAYELLVYRNRATCGIAWNEALQEAQGEYILLAADDLEAHPGWMEAGIECIEKRHALPCPRILNWDGTLQSCGSTDQEARTGDGSQVARIPFFPRSLVSHLYPIFSNHYAGDYWITWKARKAGWPTVVIREMLFTHHMLEQGRLDTLGSDWSAYQKAIRSSA